MAEVFLETKNLSVGYGTTVILDGVELTISPGEILTVIAPNGVGKSTLLKTLIRQLPAISGVVMLDHQPLAAYAERDLARKSAAVLTGRPEPEKMTCEEVVSAGRYPYTGRLGILSADDRLAVEEAMSLVRVLPLRDRDFNCLSDGQRLQRDHGMCRILCHRRRDQCQKRSYRFHPGKGGRAVSPQSGSSFLQAGNRHVPIWQRCQHDRGIAILSDRRAVEKNR